MKRILVIKKDWQRSYFVSEDGPNDTFEFIARSLIPFTISEGRDADPEWFFEHLPGEIKMLVRSTPREPRQRQFEGADFLWLNER